jgi:hypothetical protein
MPYSRAVTIPVRIARVPPARKEIVPKANPSRNEGRPVDV